MTQYYIGTKQIQAWPQDRDQDGATVPGYAVKYPDGYISWSPAETFERAYLPMGESSDGSKITKAMVEDFITSYQVLTIEPKTTVVTATLANGFALTEASACVDPDNYDEGIGAHLCKEKIAAQVWMLLGFLLQTARHGISQEPPTQ